MLAPICKVVDEYEIWAQKSSARIKRFLDLIFVWRQLWRGQCRYKHCCVLSYGSSNCRYQRGKGKRYLCRTLPRGEESCDTKFAQFPEVKWKFYSK